MITLFLIIAFLIRKNFLPKNATTSDKVLYYIFSVTMTPLIGPFFAKMLLESEFSDHDDDSGGGCFIPPGVI
jgi:hypothetical protein